MSDLSTSANSHSPGARAGGNAIVEKTWAFVIESQSNLLTASHWQVPRVDEERIATGDCWQLADWKEFCGEAVSGAQEQAPEIRGLGSAWVTQG